MVETSRWVEVFFALSLVKNFKLNLGVYANIDACKFHKKTRRYGMRKKMAAKND